MSLIEMVANAKTPVFRRTVIYGGHGWGKTTWASKWKKPVVLRTEDGCSHIDVEAFPLCVTYLDVTTIVMELLSAEKLPWSTLVIDSADWTEQLIWREVEQKHEVETITDIDYGRGYAEARKKFRSLLTSLDALRKRGMHIVWTAHQHVVRVKRTDGTEYDQYQPKLHQKVSEDLMEWADEVLHADWKIAARKTNPKGPTSQQTAVGTAMGRVLYTHESPQRMAKSRLMVDGQPVPEEIEVSDLPEQCFDAYRSLLIKGSK